MFFTHLKKIVFGLPPQRWLIRMIQGILVGSGAILPGISGGVLCVLFGIYQPMMEFFAHPIRNFMTVMPRLFPAGVGWFAGFVVFAKLVTMLFQANANMAIWLFIGLIAGSFPSLYQEAGKQGHGRTGWTSMMVSFIIMAAFFGLLSKEVNVRITPSVFWYGFCGVLWGLSVVLPGVSSSSTLIFLGLFEPMTEGIAAFDPLVVFPIFIGAGLTIVLLSRGINYIFSRFYCAAFHAVAGFVIASTLVIVPTSYKSWGSFAGCLVCAVAGFFGAWWLEHRQKRIQRQREST